MKKVDCIPAACDMPGHVALTLHFTKASPALQTQPKVDRPSMPACAKGIGVDPIANDLGKIEALQAQIAGAP
jgi:hypothetical protein